MGWQLQRNDIRVCPLARYRADQAQIRLAECVDQTPDQNECDRYESQFAQAALGLAKAEFFLAKLVIVHNQAAAPIEISEEFFSKC